MLAWFLFGFRVGLSECNSVSPHCLNGFCRFGHLAGLYIVRKIAMRMFSAAKFQKQKSKREQTCGDITEIVFALLQCFNSLKQFPAGIQQVNSSKQLSVYILKTYFILYSWQNNRRHPEKLKIVQSSTCIDNG